MIKTWLTFILENKTIDVRNGRVSVLSKTKSDKLVNRNRREIAKEERNLNDFSNGICLLSNANQSVKRIKQTFLSASKTM